MDTLKSFMTNKKKESVRETKYTYFVIFNFFLNYFVGQNMKTTKFFTLYVYSQPDLGRLPKLEIRCTEKYQISRG